MLMMKDGKATRAFLKAVAKEDPDALQAVLEGLGKNDVIGQAPQNLMFNTVGYENILVHRTDLFDHTDFYKGLLDVAPQDMKLGEAYSWNDDAVWRHKE